MESFRICDRSVWDRMSKAHILCRATNACWAVHANSSACDALATGSTRIIACCSHQHQATPHPIHQRRSRDIENQTKPKLEPTQ